MKFTTKMGAYLLGFLFGMMVLGGVATQGAFANAQVLTSASTNSCLSLQGNVGYGFHDYNTGNAVSALQAFLNNQGYFNSVYLGTGSYGSITLRSVAQFQAAHGIPATGFVGPLTRAAIAQITCGTGTVPPSTNAATLYSINPTSGTIGTTVSITGFGFTGSNTVLMDGLVAASNVPITSSIAIACTTNPACHGGINQTITFTIPASIAPNCTAGQMCAQFLREVTAGTYTVTVLNNNGTSNTINFTVTDGTVVPPTSGAPTINSLNTTSGPVGTTVTITGSNLTSSNTILMSGSVAASNVPVTSSYAIPVACNPFASSCGGGAQQTLTFTVPSSLSAYCAPGTACPMYARLVTPGTYTISVLNTNGTSNTVNFTVTGTTNNQTLSISGLSAPASLSLGQQGTWTVNAVSNGQGNLHYSVVWGDEASMGSSIMAPQTTSVQSSATFTHAYSRSGNFTPTFTVTDDSGHSVQSSNTVVVTPLY